MPIYSRRETTPMLDDRIAKIERGSFVRVPRGTSAPTEPTPPRVLQERQCALGCGKQTHRSRLTTTQAIAPELDNYVEMKTGS